MNDHDGYWILGAKGSGVFEYMCPSCSVIIFSNDLWRYYEENTFDFTFKCEVCTTKLKTYWDKQESVQYVVLDDEGVDK